MAPVQAEIAASMPNLHVRVDYLNQPFEAAYPAIKQLLEAGRYRNVLFNLDQCGHSRVDRRTLIDIMRSYPSVEIFYTFAIEALVAFLQKSAPDLLAAQLTDDGKAAANTYYRERRLRRDSMTGTEAAALIEYLAALGGSDAGS